MGLKGRHNQFNALAAYAMGERLSLNKDSMIATLQNFSGLSHRCETVAIHQEITFINDSKGTNEGACIAAVEGLAAPDHKNIVLIAGGDDKGAEFNDLNKVVNQYVKTVVLIGKAQDKLKQLLQKDNTVLLANDMQEAVGLARSAASANDLILLSPACASFDMFSGFEHRGQVFIDAVKALIDQEKKL